jgi:hypothetical protein
MRVEFSLASTRVATAGEIQRSPFFSFFSNIHPLFPTNFITYNTIISPATLFVSFVYAGIEVGADKHWDIRSKRKRQKTDGNSEGSAKMGQPTSPIRLW